MNSKQKEVDSLLKKILRLSKVRRKTTWKLKYWMYTGNFIFYRIPEVKGETDDNCVRKLLTFMEEMLQIENARPKRSIYTGHIEWEDSVPLKIDR